MSTWDLTVKTLTGICYNVQVPNTATGLQVKEAIEEKDKNLPTRLQRLVGPKSVKINDDSRLSECKISNGDTLNLVILTPFDVYVQGLNGKNRTVYVDSEMSTVSELRVLVGRTFGHHMSGCQLFYLGRPVDEIRQGTEMRLKDYSMKPGSILVMTKMGQVLDVTDAKIDVCFLVDCTASMGPYIEAVKNNISNLRNKLHEEYRNCDVVFSFVRYTDFDHPDSKKTSYLQFTSDPRTFQDFVRAIGILGGTDFPEDIMGGFKVTFTDLNWRSESCKILIHIADAPCHGNQYHNLRDNYPNGDRDGITHESMMEQILQLDIQYFFGYIRKRLTDQMIGIFDDYLQALSEQRLMIRQFDAMKCDEIGEAVQRSVMSSVYGKAALKARDFTLVPDIPDWNDFSIFEETAKRTLPVKIRSLSDIHDASIEVKEPSVNFEFKIAPNPFYEGSECYVYYASDLIDFRKIVLKLLKKNDTLEDYMKKMENRVFSTAYARGFSEEKLKPPNTCSLDFTPLEVIDSAGTFYMMESFLKGKVPKPAKDCDGATKAASYSDLLEAFSHYSWVKSGRKLLISGLQGFKKKLQNKIVLIDPTVHSNGDGGTYGVMDRGMEGIQKFFECHTCSDVCSKMKLTGQFPELS